MRPRFRRSGVGSAILPAVDLTLKVVSERLGHSSPAFTMSVYQHVLPGMQRDAAELFTKLVITDEDDGLWCR